jgi:hypothetical protein
MRARIRGRAAAAALYKWNDENGRIVYGDTPPPGVKAERVNPAVAPADPNAVRDMAAKDAQMNKRQQERTDDAAKVEKAQANAKAKIDRCAQARGNLQTLRASQVGVYRFNEKGRKDIPRASRSRKGHRRRRKAIARSQLPRRPRGPDGFCAGPARSPSFSRFAWFIFTSAFAFRLATYAAVSSGAHLFANVWLLKALSRARPARWRDDALDPIDRVSAALVHRAHIRR